MVRSSAPGHLCCGGVPPYGIMKRRTEPEFSSPQKKQKKKVEDLGLTLSSTSDDEAQLSNHTTQESSSSSSGSESESDEKRLGFNNEFKQDSLVEGTSSRYSMYNSVSQKLMAKMGFREGEGLGKYGQGRKDIVEASNQKGRRGFGLTLKGFDGELNIDWQDEPEVSLYCFEYLFIAVFRICPQGMFFQC